MTVFVYVNTSKQVGDPDHIILAWSSRSTGCCTAAGTGR
jgi:hypothetical protein